jgi:hypothetical protein
MRFGEHFVTTETLYLLRSILRQGRLVMPGETVEIARGWRVLRCGGQGCGENQNGKA